MRTSLVFLVVFVAVLCSLQTTTLAQSPLDAFCKFFSWNPICIGYSYFSQNSAANGGASQGSAAATNATTAAAAATAGATPAVATPTVATPAAATRSLRSPIPIEKPIL